MHIATTHKNTDFDALASVIAVSLLYPEAVPVLPKSLNPNVKAFLSIHKDLPVVSDGTLVGMISRRDFRRMKKESQLTAPVKAFMTQKVKTISPGRSPLEAARLMVKHDIGRLPVVEEGKVIGIITRSDAMLYFYDLLPD